MSKVQLVLIDQKTLQDALHATERSNGPLYLRAQAIMTYLTKQGLVIAEHSITPPKPLRRHSLKSDEFYRGVEIGREVEYAAEQARRGNTLDPKWVKLLREYDSDALTDTPYDEQ